MIKSPRVSHLGRALRTPHSKSLLAAQSRRDNNRDGSEGKIAHGLTPTSPSLPLLLIGLLMVYLETLGVLYALLLPMPRLLLFMPRTVIGRPHLLHTRQKIWCQTNRRQSFRQNRRLGTQHHPGIPRPHRKVRATVLCVCKR